MRKLSLLSLLCISAVFVYAQERVVSGQVTDDSGESLPGVNVIVKGTNRGVVADLDGKYSISISGSDAVLVYSFVGFKQMEEEVGSRTVIDVIMGGATSLEEVVVTGMAIEREKRSLGYGISQVSGDEMTVARESNIVNALQGKTTGLIVNQSSGNLGGSSQVIIRGITSLSGANNPLWVVDGIPIFNNQTVTGSRISGNRDFFNGAAVINPDDVESINVLKGAAATALYGSRAAAGAILVVTKKAALSKGGRKGPQISISSSTRFDDLFRTPNMQYQYSGGAFGKYDSSAVSNAFGAPVQGQEVSKAVTDERVPLRAYKDNYKDFYEVGTTLINNIAIADVGPKFDYRFSASSLNQRGTLPNSSLDRITIGVNAGVKHADWLTTRVSAQYIRTNVQGTGVAGANDQNIIGWTTFIPTTDFRDFRPWKDASGSQINTPERTTNNPLWLRYENDNDRVDNRVLVSLVQVITPIKDFHITSRLGYDFQYDERQITNSVGTITALTGSFDVDVIHRRQLNWDAIVDYSRTFGDVQLKGLVGFNYNTRVFERETLEATDLAVPGLLSPSAAQTNSPTRDFSESALLGAYAQLDVTYKNWLTLTLTGRNDWSSALPKNNNSYFYPSVSAAFVFTDALGIANKVLSFGKLRASWAQVGNTTAPYGLDFRFFPEATADGQYSLNLNFPFQGQLGFNKTSIVPNAGILPEEQDSYEIGTELQLWDGRIGIDFAYYFSSNKNQIINQPIPESTGFAEKKTNTGELISSGVEVSVNATVVDVRDFKWNTTINFSTNKVEVSDLGAKEVLLPRSSAFNSVQVVAVDGGSVELKGISWQRDSATNRPLINPQTGRRIAGESKSLGAIFPEASWGFINQFSYKGFSLSIAIDGKIGGRIKSASVESLWDGGYTEETAVNRQGTYLDAEGVIKNEDGTVRDNDVPVRATETFWENLSANSVSEHAVFDASFIKLREVGLYYSFPRSIIDKTPFTGIRLGFEARNLALLYSKIPHIDPEANLFGSGSAGFGVERNSTPSVRSMGFNVQLKF